MYRPVFTINNSRYDSSTNFDMVINDQIKVAKEQKLPFVWTIDFIRTDSIKTRSDNCPLQLKIPILPEYEGYTQKEAVQAILCYIKEKIKQKYTEIKADKSPVKARMNSETLKFFKALDICSDLDLDGSIQSYSHDYIERTSELSEAVKLYIAKQKMSHQAIQTGHITVGTAKKDIYLTEFAFNAGEDRSTHFDYLIYDKIAHARDIQKPVVLILDIIKTNSLKSSASNTPIQIIVPVLPINTALDENRQRSVIETQISALVHYVRSEIESYYKKSLESSDPATKKEASAFIETLKGLDVTKGIDFYQSEKMIKQAETKLANYMAERNHLFSIQHY